MCFYYGDYFEKVLNKILEEKEKVGFEMLEEDVVIFCFNRVCICVLFGF